ncbi:UNVERIFIED_CONTAM: hypothetical protein FKN15_071902 [Acipenser sinensis]
MSQFMEVMMGQQSLLMSLTNRAPPAEPVASHSAFQPQPLAVPVVQQPQGVWDIDAISRDASEGDPLLEEDSPGTDLASQHSEHDSESEALDTSDPLWSLVERATRHLGIEWQAVELPRRSLFESPSVRSPMPRTLPAFPDFIKEVQSTWGAPASSPATSRKASAFAMQGASEAGLASFPPVDAAFAALVKTPTLSGLVKDPACPNKQCRTTEIHLKKGYLAATEAVKLSNVASLLTVYQASLIRDLPEHLSPSLKAELALVAQFLVKIAQLNARAQGRSIASLVVARRQLWLSQARVQEPDKAPLLDAPITPGHTFGPAVEEMLQRLVKAREASQQMAKMWPHKPFQPSAEGGALEVVAGHAHEALASPLVNRLSLNSPEITRQPFTHPYTWQAVELPRRSLFESPSVRSPLPRTLPAFPDFIKEVQSTWGAPASSSATSRKASVFAMQGASEAGLASFPPVDAAFAALVKTPTLSGLVKDPACPNKQCRTNEIYLKKGYLAATEAVKLSNVASLLTVYQASLVRDLPEHLSASLKAELALVAQFLVKIAQLNARAQGRSIASLVVARRQLWLSQARVQEPDKAPLLDAPITPGHTFGPAVEEMLQRSVKAREASQQMAKMWPHKPFQPRRHQEHQWHRAPPQRQTRPGGTKTSPSATAARSQPHFSRPQRGGWRPRGGGRPRPRGSGQPPREQAQPKQP